MKLKDRFVMTELGEESVLVPVGEPAEGFRGIVRLNETAAFIIKQLKENTTTDQIVDALLAEYEVERSEAEKHVNAVLSQLREIDAIEE